jgi:16S rRNA processing protein RimM
LPVALHVKGVRDQGDAIVALAPEIPDRDAAEALKGVRIFVSRASFPAPDPDEFYWVDLIGLAVTNREGVALGEVVGLIDTGPHCVLRVAPPPGAEAEERLIPFVDAYVDTVDLPGRRLVVDWGLDY